MSRSHKEIEEAFFDQKIADYELIKAAGFDSEHIADMWDDDDGDVQDFIAYLYQLEADAHAQMMCREMGEENGLE